MIEYRQYEKGCDEDGPEPYPSRELPAGERQQDASFDPSLPSRKAEDFMRFSRVPPLQG
jgi:hypothetical protein